MTPAQEAKEFAAAHNFDIAPFGRRYNVWLGDQLVAEVGGYPAALNAMKRQITFRNDAIQDERGESSVWAIPDECVASGVSCSYGRWGRDDERQCKYCGKVQDMLDPAATVETIRTGYYVRTAPTGSNDMFCSSYAEAVHVLRSAANFYRRAKVSPPCAMSIVFKRGAA